MRNICSLIPIFLSILLSGCGVLSYPHPGYRSICPKQICTEIVYCNRKGLLGKCKDTTVREDCSPRSISGKCYGIHSEKWDALESWQKELLLNKCALKIWYNTEQTLLHTFTGNEYVVFGSEAHSVRDTVSMNKYCDFMGKEGGKYIMKCGTNMRWDSTCVDKTFKRFKKLKKRQKDLAEDAPDPNDPPFEKLKKCQKDLVWVSQFRGADGKLHGEWTCTEEPKDKK